ncbi:MAG: 30S ribosomal protein S15 [Candidatus Thorarchaeota archaeon]|nr:30S ribosomal protein S15 [Candidatus Thorarchaeota archaeon]
MARVHTRRKGQSGSKRPSTLRVPGWMDRDPQWVENMVVELAKAGNSPSMIGILLRDQYGVPLVRVVTGQSIMDIIRKNNLERRIPEDLRDLIRKAASMRRHLEGNKKDLVSKRRLQLVESKILRLSRYYARERVLPADWKYSPDRAAVDLK